MRVSENHELTDLEIRILTCRDIIKIYLTEEQQYLEKIIRDIQSQTRYNDEMHDNNETIQQRLLEVTELKDNFAEQQTELQQQSELIQQQIEDKRQQLHNGLSPARIQQFHQFLADQSLVGDHCGVCLDDIELGRRMMRLDCNGQHAFCQGCVEGWFADHNTCPNCRHLFQ